MIAFSKLNKLALASIVARGGLAHYHLKNANDQRKIQIRNECTDCCSTATEWNKNWDFMEPESLVKPPEHGKDEENRYKNETENLRKNQSLSVNRELFLIRHEQNETTDNEKVLTEDGKQQAELTGKRLKSLKYTWNLLISSTEPSAQEMSNIIAQHLPEDLTRQDCPLLQEGIPIKPTYGDPVWHPEYKYFKDSIRIEAAYRRYFYRAPPEQSQHTYTILVCHSNVIQYFICRALQFSAEGWNRMTLNGSITRITIKRNGHVQLKWEDDTLPTQQLNSSR